MNKINKILKSIYIYVCVCSVAWKMVQFVQLTKTYVFKPESGTWPCKWGWYGVISNSVVRAHPDTRRGLYMIPIQIIRAYGNTCRLNTFSFEFEILHFPFLHATSNKLSIEIRNIIVVVAPCTRGAGSDPCRTWTNRNSNSRCGTAGFTSFVLLPPRMINCNSYFNNSIVFLDSDNIVHIVPWCRTIV